LGVRELENKQGAVERLELLLQERLTKIDELHGTIDRLREQNRRLDAEAEHLAEMVAAPQVNAAAELGKIIR
jgi:regulator of replication initiation timing